MIVVAVPVKDLVNAKQRLVPVLGPAERAALARAMLGDVLRAVRAARVDAVWVVTRDPAVTAIAADAGAAVVPESENRGHTAAVARAQQRAGETGARIFVTIPGDVPCVTTAEVDALVRAADDGPAVALTPSRSGLGTNGVALQPVGVMPLRFGEPSFSDHLTAARARGLAPRVLTLPGLGLDIDGPEDLAALLTEAADTDSARLVAGWGVTARTARAAGARPR